MKKRFSVFLIFCCCYTSVSAESTSDEMGGSDGLSSVSIEHINPDTLFDSKPYAFSQVVISRGNRMVHIAGQTSQDKDLNIIGEGDLAAQAKRAFENVGLALKAAGGSIENIVSTNVYVVNLKPESLQVVGEATANFFGKVTPPASTMVGVTALALPAFLIEIEATAVIDD